MEVLDDEEQGPPLGGGLEEGVHGIEQRRPGRRAGWPRNRGTLAALVDHPASGHEAVQGGVVAATEASTSGDGDLETAEDLGEGEVGQGAVGEVEAVAGDDLPAEVEGTVAQRGEQAGLADAGVTGEEDDAARTRVSGRDDAQPESEVLQLGISPHEGAVVTGAIQPIMSVGTDMEPLVSVVVPTTGSADPRGAGAVFLPAQPATGTTGADGAPVLADPVHAVLDLRVDQHVVHRSSPSSIPGRSRYE